MKTRFLFLSSAIAVALFIAASRIIGAEALTAGSVSAEDRLSIAQPGYSGQWKGNDLSVEYSYSKDQGQMDLSGNIRFASYLILGYSRVKDFRLNAIFIDENGSVLEEMALAADRGTFDPVSFHHRINLPSNAVSMAFSYQGKACESASGGGTSFWYSPIH